MNVQLIAVYTVILTTLAVLGILGPELIFVVVNGITLYVLYLRVHAELKAGWFEEYKIAVPCAILLAYVLPRIPIFSRITIAAAIAVGVVQILIIHHQSRIQRHKPLYNTQKVSTNSQ